MANLDLSSIVAGDHSTGVHGDDAFLDAALRQYVAPERVAPILASLLREIMSPDGDERLIQSPGVEERAIEGSTFLVAPGSGALHHMSSLAMVIWRQFAQANIVDEILVLLVAAFPDEAAGKIEDDLDDLVAGLRQMGLLVPAAMETPLN